MKKCSLPYPRASRIPFKNVYSEALYKTSCVSVAYVYFTYKTCNNGINVGRFL